MTSLRTRHFSTRHLLAPLVFFLALLLTACGGGSSSSSPTLSGTAATGLAIANATITVVDAAGISRTTTTNASGNYSLDVSGMTAPFLVKVDDGAGLVLYSVGNAAGIANIHPLTDLIVKTWYQVQGTTADAAFLAPATNPPPTVTELKVITEVVVHVVQTWLASAGLDPTAFNIFTTPFTAGSGTGFDGFLDKLTVDTTTTPSAPVITVTSGSDGQTSNMTIAGTGDISVNTTITINGVTGTTLTTAFVPSTQAASDALTGILTSLGSMADVVNTKGMSLAGSDLLQFFDAGYLDFGLNQSQGADWLSGDLQGVTLSSFVVDSVLGFDSGNNIMTIIGRATVSANGVTTVQYANGDGHGMTFKKQGNGSWLFYGDQQQSKANVSVNTTTNYTSSACTGCSGVAQYLQVQVMTPQGSLSSSVNSTVTGLFNGASTTVNLTNDNTTTEKGISFDQFNADDGGGSFYKITSLANVPPAGSQYDFALTLADNVTPENYSVKLGAATQESITLKNGVETTLGHSWSAVKDKPVTISWNLPTTFAIAKVEVYAHVDTASNGSCDINLPSTELLTTTSTSAIITVPSTCNGGAVTTSPGYPSISVVVKGINGEDTEIWYAFNDA